MLTACSSATVSTGCVVWRETLQVFRRQINCRSTARIWLLSWTPLFRDLPQRLRHPLEVSFLGHRKISAVIERSFLNCRCFESVYLSGKILIKDEVGRIWKYPVVTYCRLLSKYLSRGIKEKHKHSD